jgi:L-lactate dehydrogenase complex protein LldG
MWKRIKTVFTNQKKTINEGENHLTIHSSLLQETDDIQFVKKFNESGGYFFYCENHHELVQSLHSIIIEKNANKIVCLDLELQNLLTNIGIDFLPQINECGVEDLFLFIPCEYLISYDGSIMVSSDQTKSFKLNQLPFNIIVYSKPEQIAANLSCALRGIKKNKNDNIPNNIACIKGPKSQDFGHIPNAKNIYLLLTE